MWMLPVARAQPQHTLHSRHFLFRLNIAEGFLCKEQPHPRKEDKGPMRQRARPRQNEQMWLESEVDLFAMSVLAPPSHSMKCPRQFYHGSKSNANNKIQKIKSRRKEAANKHIN